MQARIKSGLWIALIGVIGIALLMGMTSQVQADTKRIVFSAGPAGGGWYGMAGAMGELIKKASPGTSVTVMPGGGVGNNTVVEKGKALLGFSSGPLVKAAIEGKAPYDKEHPHLKTVLKMGVSDMAIFLVRENTPINTISDLKKKKFPLRLVTTRKTSTPALGAARLLGEYGVSFQDLKDWGGSVTFTNYADAATLISDGHADAIIAVSVPAIVEMVRRVKMKWLPPEEAVVESMMKKYGYAKNLVHKGKYVWAHKDAYTIGEPLVMIIRDNVSDDMAYLITKSICEKPETVRGFGKYYKAFGAKNAWQGLGGPLHPGAAKYYREAGYIK
jgi:TRAP transporter TAXI family solute receptor